MSHSFSYENEMTRFSTAPDEVLVQLDGENNSVVYCSQCQLCNKTKENNVSNEAVAKHEQPKNNNNNVDNAAEVKNETSSDKVVETSESRKTTVSSSRVVIDCDAIVSLPHCDDLKSTNGKNVSSQRSKKKKKGRQLLYSNGASSDVKESSSQAGEKGSNDDEVSLTTL